MCASPVASMPRSVPILASAFTKAQWIPKFIKPTSVGVKREEYTIDCTRYQKNLGSNTELKSRVDDLYHRIGLVYLTNTGTKDAAELQKPFDRILGTGNLYEGGANPRSAIEGNVYDTGVSMESFVHYHHEMAYVDKSVKNVFFTCSELSPGVDGSSYVSDNIRVTNALSDTVLGRKLREKGVCYVRKLTDRKHFQNLPQIGVYNHWQKSFLTEDPKVAEIRANERGLRVEWGRDRLMITKYFAPSYEYCPPIDRNLLYASMADHSIWFDTWPLVEQLPQEERPLKMTYGDESEFTDSEVAQLVDVYDDFGIQLDWNPGEAAIVCNFRFLHGRPIIKLRSGEVRNLGVVLGEFFKRQGPLPGKW
ncbi:uncharacterized protein LOC142340087 [Convolutriloba macropyga]|uniref:uncharacterized protein LOC142340087 n=1 Tax=Convolutriloba macropyga TaxID=536237 RepID=UPI003F528CA2